MPNRYKVVSADDGTQVKYCGIRWSCWRKQEGKEVPYDPPENLLKVLQTDLNLKENGQLHRTGKYELMRRVRNPHLIVRRGQEFKISLTFDRPYDRQSDRLHFIFSVVKDKEATERTLNQGIFVPLTPSQELDPDQSQSNLDGWSATIDKIDGSTLTVQLKSSSKCSVGKWTLMVDSSLSDSKEVLPPSTYNFVNPIYILFNPWNESDQVFLKEEESRVEYVLEDSGLIWQGTHNSLRPVPWAYSQFELDILDCSLDLLHKGTNVLDRSCSIKTCRVLSALVNSLDDDGILVGKWDGDFGKGTHPTKWNGSCKILQQFHDKKKPVMYGQCWVFAGVLTSVCRSLGIPTRPVTNFSSAHDTQSSMTIDYVFDAEGQPVKELSQDSVWNFHVWCEVWMSREDLESESGNLYGGWQAIDATPQELSSGIYRLGPAPVVACKRGDIKKPHDVDFLFSEVNADKVYWRYLGPKKPLKLLSILTDAKTVVGLHISTKAIGKLEREDITDNYKYPEKSAEERASMLNALRLSESSFSRFYLNEEFTDVKFDLKLLDDVVIGSPFRILLTVENTNSKEDFNIEGVIRVDNVLYTGTPTDLAVKKSFSILVSSKTRRQTTMTVVYGEYSKRMSLEAAFNVSCLAKVKESGFEFFSQDDFRVRKPDVKFQVPKDILIGKKFRLTATLLNPLPVKLTKCRFLVDAPGFDGLMKIKVPTEVKAGGLAEAKFELTASIDGSRMITVGFTSNELKQVDGFVSVDVKTIEELT